MKLYYSKGTCSLAPRIVIHELQLSCSFEAVNLTTKKTETGADFLNINPKGSVPALELDNGTILTENLVIQQYLADTFNGQHLLPPLGNFNRYRVLEWLSFASSDLHKSFGPLFNPEIPTTLKDSVFKPLLFKRLSYLDTHLAQSKYLVGNEFTLPDAYVFVTLTWLHYFHIALEEWPHLQHYFERIKQRDSVIKALTEEGLT